MAYATVSNISARLTRALSAAEQNAAETLLEDAAIMIDAVAPKATDDQKMIVSCRMVIRAIGDGSSSGLPVGATQGSMSGLGYTQSWTVGIGGSTGELYLSRQDRRLLGIGNSIGSYSPVEEMVCSEELL